MAGISQQTSTGFLDNSDGALLEQQAASLQAQPTGTPTASSPAAVPPTAAQRPAEQATTPRSAQDAGEITSSARDERERAAKDVRRQLKKQAAEDQLNKKLTELGFQLLSPVDLNLDWKSFLTEKTKVALRGTYIQAHDVELLSTPDNKDQPTIRLYTNHASRDARKLMLECRNSNFKFSSCDMIVGATIQNCIRNKGELNEKEIPCLNVQEAYLVP